MVKNRDLDATLKKEGFIKWIFTFGGDHENAGTCQPIYAKNSDAARKKMFEMYGEKWCWQYSEEDWAKAEANPKRWWPMDKELEPVVVRDEV